MRAADGERLHAVRPVGRRDARLPREARAQQPDEVVRVVLDRVHEVDGARCARDAQRGRDDARPEARARHVEQVVGRQRDLDRPVRGHGARRRTVLAGELNAELRPRTLALDRGEQRERVPSDPVEVGERIGQVEDAQGHRASRRARVAAARRDSKPAPRFRAIRSPPARAPVGSAPHVLPRSPRRRAARASRRVRAGRPRRVRRLHRAAEPRGARPERGAVPLRRLAPARELGADDDGRAPRRPREARARVVVDPARGSARSVDRDADAARAHRLFRALRRGALRERRDLRPDRRRHEDPARALVRSGPARGAARAPRPRARARPVGPEPRQRAHGARRRDCDVSGHDGERLSVLCGGLLAFHALGAPEARGAARGRRRRRTRARGPARSTSSRASRGARRSS